MCTCNELCLLRLQLLGNDMLSNGQVVIGARVMLRHNVCRTDGLVNGAMGK